MRNEPKNLAFFSYFCRQKDENDEKEMVNHTSDVMSCIAGHGR
jgi:hypothetical protein